MVLHASASNLVENSDLADWYSFSKKCKGFSKSHTVLIILFIYIYIYMYFVCLFFYNNIGLKDFFFNLGINKERTFVIAVV